MDIDRRRECTGPNAPEWLKFCLDKLEAAKDFSGGMSWQTEIVPGLTVEEMVGAIVAAELWIEETASDDIDQAEAIDRTAYD